MTLALLEADRLDLAPAVLDALRQANNLSDEARERPIGGQDIDHRARVLLDRMALLLPVDSAALPQTDTHTGLPPAYTRDDGDLRAVLKAMPEGWRIVAFLHQPVAGRGGRWTATLLAPDGSQHAFEGRTITLCALRALLAAFAGLLLEQAEKMRP